MIIEYTIDKSRIKKILTSDCLWERIRDYAISKDEFTPDVVRFHHFVLSVDGEDIGLYMFEKLNTKTLVIHPAILKKFRKAFSYKSYEAVKESIIEKTIGITNLVCFIPTCYKDCINFALHFGFSKVGVLPASSEREGKILDQVIMSKRLWAD